MDLQSLPYDEMHHILKLLDLDSLPNLFKTSKHFKSICNDPRVQKQMINLSIKKNVNLILEHNMCFDSYQPYNRYNTPANGINVYSFTIYHNVHQPNETYTYTQVSIPGYHDDIRPMPRTTTRHAITKTLYSI